MPPPWGLYSLCQMQKMNYYNEMPFGPEPTPLEDREFISKGTIKKELGWTDGSIKNFLGEPDKLASNPNYRSGPPMQLYLQSRVRAAMETEEWKGWYTKTLARRQKQSERSKAIAEKKREQAIAQSLKQLKVKFPKVKSESEAYRLARQYWAEHKEALALSRGEFPDFVEVPGSDVDIDTQYRWLNNWIRHELSNYEAILESLSGQIGINASHDELQGEIEKRTDQWMSQLSQE